MCPQEICVMRGDFLIVDDIISSENLSSVIERLEPNFFSPQPNFFSPQPSAQFLQPAFFSPQSSPTKHNCFGRLLPFFGLFGGTFQPLDSPLATVTTHAHTGASAV